jgi:hypothetical protein
MYILMLTIFFSEQVPYTNVMNMVRVLTRSVVDREFEPRSGQTRL